jgi:two-component system, NtrC family, nitrogen regulation sensor histidine kinase NtrY
MDFKNFKFNVVLRVLVMALTTFLFTYTVLNDSFLLTKALILGLLVYQVYSLIQHVDKTNRDLSAFLNAIAYDDFTQTFSSKDGSFNELNDAFNRVAKKFREIRAEKEAHYHYLKTIVQHVGIGLLTFNKEGEIQIINTAAKRLFKVTQLRNIKALGKYSPALVESFERLQTGGRDLVKIERNGDTVQLAIYAIELNLRGEEFKLISVQNIQSELEEKEMEAWQNLIRVLTHEIMNSVTPISSLASTLEGEMEHQLEVFAENKSCMLPKEDVEDLHLGLQTIRRRSEGLIRFVSDFRNMATVPTPKPEKFQVKEIFDRIATLMRHETEKAGIEVEIGVKPGNLSLLADTELIEQVLINILQNAVHAVTADDKPEKKIMMSAYQDSKNRTIVSIKDNGVGIDEEALGRIFIPFFTTKKQGSGIGLSLSRQIMRKHKATISAKSKLKEGTEFILKF